MHYGNGSVWLNASIKCVEATVTRLMYCSNKGTGSYLDFSLAISKPYSHPDEAKAPVPQQVNIYTAPNIAPRYACYYPPPYQHCNQYKWRKNNKIKTNKKTINKQSFHQSYISILYLVSYSYKKRLGNSTLLPWN